MKKAFHNIISLKGEGLLSSYSKVFISLFIRIGNFPCMVVLHLAAMFPKPIFDVKTSKSESEEPVKEFSKHVLCDVVRAVQVKCAEGGSFSAVHPLQEMS